MNDDLYLTGFNRDFKEESGFDRVVRLMEEEEQAKQERERLEEQRKALIFRQQQELENSKKLSTKVKKCLGDDEVCCSLCTIS